MTTDNSTARKLLAGLTLLWGLGGCADQRSVKPADLAGPDLTMKGDSGRDRDSAGRDRGNGEMDAGGCITEDTGTVVDGIHKDVGAGDDSAADGDMGGGGEGIVRDSSADDSGAGEDAMDSGASEDAMDSGAREDAVDSGVVDCPPEMVPMGLFCIDIYEAARADATASSGGTSVVAVALSGVIPWIPVTLAQARAACVTAGKRLCRPDEWMDACQGPTTLVYSYGNVYDPLACNGIDSFCNCSAPACLGLTTCPYPHCFNRASVSESGGPCGASFHVMPTGSFPACTNVYGLFDVNGNVWEIVDTTDGLEHFRGGAFNCGDSELLHRCDYDATWNPSAKGFRCCKDRVFP